MTGTKRGLFVKSDIDAAFGVFFDGFTKVIAGVGIMIGGIGLSNELVFGTILPGLGFGVLLLHLFTWWYGNMTGKRTGNPGIVAMPAGITAGRFFVWLSAIMLPTYAATGDAKLALGVGLAANVVSSLFTVVLAFVGPYLLKILPSAALFGSLAGGGITWLILASFNDMFTSPIIAVVCFFIIIIMYITKMKCKLSPVVLSIAVGVIIGFATGDIATAQIADSFSNIGFSVPLPALEYLMAGFGEVIKFIPIIIAFSIAEMVSALQGIEQARVTGDEYDGKMALVGVSIASAISAVFGNPFCFSLWWGYGTWKEIKASTGYSLLVGIAYFLLCSTGLVAIVTTIIPTSAVLPILVFVGMCSFGGAFTNENPKYFGIMAIAAAIPIIEYIGNLSGANMPASLMIMGQGAPLIALVWGSILVYAADLNFRAASIASLVGAAMSFVGLIHAPGLGVNASPMMSVAYLIVGVGLLALSFTKVEVES
ncbi:MAG: hypothetical protein ACRCW2_10985 [Cellulosilyticaceae bacterium]